MANDAANMNLAPERRGNDDAHEGRPPPALRPAIEPVGPAQVETMEAYVGRFRLVPRFVTTPSNVNRPLMSIPINFEAIRTQLLQLLSGAFLHWAPLRELFHGDDNGVDLSITLGCENLASAMCLMIYNLLRYKCSVHDSQNQAIYRARCHFDIGTELPSGCAFLVEQFGFATPVDVTDNPNFIHRWDNANNGDRQFGLDNAHALNNHIFTGFCSQLSRVGVPFRRIDRYCAPRNLWDSLYIEGDENIGYTAFTTYPTVNYLLPRDVFVAIGICQTSSLTANRPVMFYPPRLCPYDRATAVNNIKARLPDDDTQATAAERLAMPALANADAHATDAQLRVNHHLTHMHLTGTQRRRTGGTDDAPEYTERVWIYGRGGAQMAMRINCVARGVSEDEVDGFFRALFRHG